MLVLPAAGLLAGTTHVPGTTEPLIVCWLVAGLLFLAKASATWLVTIDDTKMAEKTMAETIVTNRTTAVVIIWFLYCSELVAFANIVRTPLSYLIEPVPSPSATEFHYIPDSQHFILWFLPQRNLLL